MRPYCGLLMTSLCMVTYSDEVQKVIKHVPYARKINHPSKLEKTYHSWGINVIFHKTTVGVEVSNMMKR